MADRVLTVKVTGETSGLGRSFNQASKQSEQFGSHMQKHVVGGLHAVARAATYAGGIIGVSYVAALGDGIRLAAGNQVAIAKLKKSVDNSGLSWKALGGHLQETQDRMATLSGFTNTELETSLSQLITTTGKAASAQKLQAEAMDLARARSMPLANATTILSKAWNGNVTSLTRLGILLPKSTKHYEAYMASTKHATIAGKEAAKAADLVSNRQAALAALQKKFGGSWKAYSETASGSLSRIKAAAEILLERMGAVLLPYLQRFAAWFTQHLPDIERIGGKAFHDLGQVILFVVEEVKDAIHFYQRWAVWIQAVAVGVGTAVVAFEAYLAVVKAIKIAEAAWAVANTLVKVTMLGIPVVALVAGLAALAAGIYVLWRRSSTFRDIVKSAWADIQRATGVLVDFIRGHWQVMLAVLTQGASVAVIFIINHWGTIKKVFDQVVGFIQRRWGNVKQAFMKVSGWVSTYIIGPIKSIINWAKQAISWLEKLNPFSSGPGGGGQGRGSSSGAAAAQMYARSRLASYGWSGSQMAPLVSLWNQESGWNNMAYNAKSGATGIPQALPYTKMPQAAWLPSQGGSASTTAQVDWGLGYIKNRKGYGSPAAAWAHEQAYNWYDNGGVVPGPRGRHHLAYVAGGETILPTHKGGGWGPTIIVNMPAGFMVGTASDFENAVRKAVVGALRRNGPNAFVPSVGSRIS